MSREHTILLTGGMPSSSGPDPRYQLLPYPADATIVEPRLADGIRAIAAAGPRKISDELMQQMPNLQIISNFGVGVDRVDVEAATRRGIVVTNTPDVLTDEVADFTLGLLIATVRRIVAADAFLRAGKWTAGDFPLSASLRGRTIGIVGMGRIGIAVANRCTAMGLDIAYHNRSRKPDLPYRYESSVIALARSVDTLMVVVPGGPETDGMIDAAVLAALGQNGVLVNVARGSVVVEQALVEALRSGQLLAAGLDVFPEEPRVAQALIDLPNVVLTPHIGSASLATRQAMGDLVFANIESWFENGKPLTPVNHIALALQVAPVGQFP